MKLTTIISLGVLAAACAISNAHAESSSASPPSEKSSTRALSDSDRQFLSYAAEDNQAEIQLCLLAEKRAGDPALKAFARLMVNDHVAIESRLAALAGDAHADLPNGIGDDGQKTWSKLVPLSGGQFDEKFLDAQIEDHTNDIKKFSAASNGSDQDETTRFASQTLPILRQHLALAQAVQAQSKRHQ